MALSVFHRIITLIHMFYTNWIIHAKSDTGNSRVQVRSSICHILVACRGKSAMSQWQGDSHRYRIYQSKQTRWSVKFWFLNLALYVSRPGIDWWYLFSCFFYYVYVNNRYQYFLFINRKFADMAIYDFVYTLTLKAMITKRALLRDLTDVYCTLPTILLCSYIWFYLSHSRLCIAHLSTFVVCHLD